VNIIIVKQIFRTHMGVDYRVQGMKFFRPDPDLVLTGLNPSRSRLNPFFANLPEIFFKQMLNEIPLYSIACHYDFRSKCDVQVYILMFLSIRCYIKLICQLQVGSGGIVPIPILFPNSVPILSGSGSRTIHQWHRDRDPDPDGFRT